MLRVVLGLGRRRPCVSADCLKTKKPLMSNKYLDKLIKDSSDKQLFKKSYTPTESIKNFSHILENRCNAIQIKQPCEDFVGRLC